jgi:hypothetical protein
MEDSMTDKLIAEAAEKLATMNAAVEKAGTDAGKGGLTGEMTEDYHDVMRKLTKEIKPLEGLQDILALPWQGNYAGDRHLMKLVEQQLVTNQTLSSDMRKQALLIAIICMYGEVGNPEVSDKTLAEWCEGVNYNDAEWPWAAKP